MNPDLVNAIHNTAPDILEKKGAFDAIIIGAGAAGGLAAEKLTKGGLKVLVLDAGFRPSFFHAPVRRLFASTVSGIANPNFLPFMSPFLLNNGRRALRLMGRVRQRIQTKCYAWERQPDSFVDDFDCPYTTPPDKPFLWIRARALKGRVGIPGHGRLYFRLGQEDFCPTDNESPAWPLTLEDIDPWYTEVEQRLGLSGTRNAIPWLPDSEIRYLLTPTKTESIVIDRIKARWPESCPILGRYAPPGDTLEGAARTGHLTVRQGAIVRSIEIANGNVSGVRWFDQASFSERKTEAPLVFLCASALESTRILMLSHDLKTNRPIGSHSTALGHYLMDHIMMHAEGTSPRPQDSASKNEDGRCIYLPRFDARYSGKPQTSRGFGLQIHRTDLGLNRSYYMLLTFSEMLPRHENHVVINKQQLDRWGIPTLHINCSYGASDLKRTKDQIDALHELAITANISIDRIDQTPAAPGHAIHECGTARMGTDPTNSVLDPNNQCWDAKGLYVTDSSSFPSQGSQNPTLTVMALTSRACSHALRSNK